MALRQFINPSTLYVPQSGFALTYSDNGGVEATHDFIIRNADIGNPAIKAAFARGVAWETVFSNCPAIYGKLTLKKADPQDRGDGFTIFRVTFTGYEFATPGSSSGEEQEQATAVIEGQLEAVPLTTHPKFVALSDDEKSTLGKLITGEWTWIKDPFDSEYKVAVNTGDGAYYIRPTADQLVSDDSRSFAIIISRGDTTYESAGYTYSYITESEMPFTASQLAKVGKIVTNPLGNPTKPEGVWTWLYSGVNQSQSGDSRYIKQRNYKLIYSNLTALFLYGE